MKYTCKLAAICLAALLFTETRVSAATITATNAAQLNSALLSVQPGDTILISGTITNTSGTAFTTKKSGTVALPITITGDGTAVIKGVNSSTYGLYITNDYCRISNFTIKNFGKGLVIGGLTLGASANHGIADNVHIMDIQAEGFKIRDGSKYWLVKNCSVRRTGQQSGDTKYGEGFYIGQANSNWINGTPDDCAYITFYNCYTLDTYNDGWDMKEGSHHVKVVNCTADFSGTIEPPLDDSVGDAGFYNRGNYCQYIKAVTKELDNGSQGFDFGMYLTYGSYHQIKQSGVILGNASFIKYTTTLVYPTIYSDYTFTSSGPFWAPGGKVGSFTDPTNFVEYTWAGEGGELYGNLNPAIGSDGDPLTASNNVAPSVSLTAPANGASYTAPASISMTATASDTDGTIASVKFYNSSTLLGTDTTSPYAHTWTNVAAGSYSLTARATDDDGAVSTSAVAVITVNAANNAPVFTVDPISKAAATEAVAYTGQTLSGSATDADGDTLSYSAQAGPSWLSIATGGALSGTPAIADAGTNSWQILVSDGTATDTAALNIIVNAAPASTGVQTNAFFSVATEDGWVRESSETSNIGGAIDSSSTYSTALRVGDDASKRQYKTVVSFDTSALPDGVTILSATLKLKCGTISSDPSGFGSLLVDIKNGTGFGGATALATGDFEAAADATGVATMNYPSANTWSTGALNAAGLAQVNKTGKTQLKVYFATDDDNDAALDYLGFYSSEAASADNYPVLEIVYQPPNVVPSVSLTAPTNGASFTAPASIAMTATASDSDGTITTVGFYNGSTLVGSDTTSPYACTWTGVAAGSYSLTARATDNQGAVSTSTVAVVSVAAAPTITNTCFSVAAEDGWVLESSETSNIGGTIDASSPYTSALRVGDDASKRQYKPVVSFDTSALPDGATIISATLRLKRGTLSNVATNLGSLMVDIKNGTGFGGATTLAPGDFEAAADAAGVATMSYPSANGIWSTGTLNAAGLAQVNKTGKTQLKVYFSTDDDNDTTADYLGFYSGEAASGNQPELVIVYQ